MRKTGSMLLLAADADPGRCRLLLNKDIPSWGELDLDGDLRLSIKNTEAR